MNKFFLLTAFILGNSAMFGQYCNPWGDCSDWIESITVSNLSKTSACSAGGYGFYDQDTIFVEAGSAYPVTIINSVYADTKASGYVDFDLNNTFDETERIDFAAAGVVGTHAGSLVVPATAASGAIFRARFYVQIATEVSDPCGGGYVIIAPYEYEDYVVKVGADPSGSYCAASGTSNASDPNCNTASTVDVQVNKVEVVGEFNNNNATCGITSPGYSDYTSIQAIIADGEDFTVNVTIGAEGSAYEAVKAWMDFNGDNVFDPVDELLASTNVPGDRNWVFTGTMASGGFTGTSRLRVRGYWGYVDDPVWAQPCGSNTIGEVEDYTVIITSANAPDCAENPGPSDGATAVCLGGHRFEWSHPDAANIDGYTISIGSTSGNYDLEDKKDVGNVLNYTMGSGLQPGKTYYWKVEPYVGAESAPACSEWSFTTAANPDPKPQFIVGGTIVEDTMTCIDAELEIKIAMSNGDGTFSNGSWSISQQSFIDVIANDSAVFQGDTPGLLWVVHTITDGNGCMGVDSIAITINPDPSTGTISPEVLTFCGQGDQDFELDGVTGTIQWQDSVPGGLWVDANGETGTSINVSINDQSSASERYVRARITENGCSAISDFSGMVVNPNPEKAGISFPEGLEFCSGDSVTLTSEMVTDSLVWLPSEADGAADLIVKTAGDVTLRRVDRLTTCFSDSTLSITEEALPVKPIMDPSTDQTICSVDLPFEVSITNPTSAVEWMTGETTTTIAINNIAEEVFVSNITDKGCKSTSDTIRIDVIAQPSQPLIEIPSGSTELCEGDSLLVRISNFNSGIVWSDGETEIQRYIKVGGTFSATFGEGTSCESISEAITVTILESPDPIQLKVEGPNPGCVGDSVYLIATNYPEVSWNNSTNTINDTLLVTTSGNYRATVESANGCTRSATEEVVLNETPEAPTITISGDGNCPGDEKILIANMEVLWDDASATVNDSLIVTDPGTYTATVSVGVCSNQSSIEVVYDGAPENPEISQSNDTLFVTPADQEGYSWYKDEELIATTTEPFLDGVEPGVYAVTYSTSGGCTSALSENFIVIGINELNAEQVLILYPNPGQGTYFLNVDAQEIKVFDALGRTVESELTKDRKLLIPDAKGHLFLQVRIGEKIYHSRLIQE